MLWGGSAVCFSQLRLHKACVSVPLLVCPLTHSLWGLRCEGFVFVLHIHKSACLGIDMFLFILLRTLGALFNLNT